MIDTEGIIRYELAELLKGRRITGPGIETADDPGLSWAPFAGGMPVTYARSLGSNFLRLIYYDYLPVGRDRCKAFVLKNVGGRLRRDAEAGNLSAFFVQQSPEEREQPHWSLRYWSCRAEWDKRRLKWDPGRWTEDGGIDVAFREPFQVVGGGESFYFITSSGKVFASPVAREGTERPMKPF